MIIKIINKLKLFSQRKKMGILDKNIIINSYSIFGDYKNIEWGNYIYIGPYAYIWATGGLKIGNNVIIGPRITIHTSNHNYENRKFLPYDGKTILKKVIIEDNVWIGDHVLITPGVTVGEGSIVAMGSVVTKDVPKCSLIGGNPARIIKRLDTNEYENLKKEEKFYLKCKLEGKIQWKKIRQK